MRILLLCVSVYASVCVKLDEVASVHGIIQPEDVNTFLVFCKNAYGEEPQPEGLKMHDCVKQSCGICARGVSMNSSVLCKWMWIDGTVPESCLEAEQSRQIGILDSSMVLLEERSYRHDMLPVSRVVISTS